MKKTIILIIFTQLIAFNSFGQKIIKGKEIGVDLRNFNQNGNVSFLVRKKTKDSSIIKRRNYSFSLTSDSRYQNFNGSNNQDIPDDYKSNTSSNTTISFTWGKEKYFTLEDFQSKNLFFYHGLLKNINIGNNSSKSISQVYDGSTGNLIFVNKNINNYSNIGIGLSLVGGLKYSFTKKMSLGIESSVSAGFSLNSFDYSGKSFKIDSKSTTDITPYTNTSTSFFVRPQIINAIWFSYNF